jgi:hypothetical protein
MSTVPGLKNAFTGRPTLDVAASQGLMCANGIRNPWRALLRALPTMWVSGFILAGAGKAAPNKRH